MAASTQTPTPITIATKAYDTALCILPPVEQSYHVQRLRELYDTAYETWPPHINLVYPFVAPEDLPEAQKRIKDEFGRDPDLNDSRRIMLDSAGMFKQRSHSTILLHESPSTSDGSLDLLRSTVLRALGQSPTQCNFHMTIGQSENNSISSTEFMLSKARLLPHLDFQIGSLAILIRERVAGPNTTSRMKLWGLIDVASDREAVWQPKIADYWIEAPNIDSKEEELETDDVEDLGGLQLNNFHLQVQPGKTYTFNASQDTWEIMTGTPAVRTPKNLTVSSYNVLIDSEFPPAEDRNSLLVDTILSSAATADILVLQEVSDDFLSHLLSVSDIRSEYPFTSHAPPSQFNVGPLPSLRNIVVLSKWPFDWKLLPFSRKHKSAMIAVFENLLSGPPLVVGGVHLTCGLTDGSVAAKKVQIQILTKYLTQVYSENPWIIAGDFNLATSTYTIDTALKDKHITSETSATLSAIEDILSSNGLLDAWSTTFADAIMTSNDDLFPGEEGATFDPRSNILAAGTSSTSNNRPQRYDRILVRPQETFCTSKFNLFGLPEQVSGEQLVASDHSGVRASMRVLEAVTAISPEHRELLAALPVDHQQVPPSITDDAAVSMLNDHGMFPTDEQVQQRETAFALLKQIVLGETEDGGSSSPDIPLVMVPVGSYALGAWTPDSDIDCLCIGTISSKTFFKLARQRLQRAENKDVRIMRKVEAGTGTMLELSVNGIAMDLQYCPAARVVERWSEFAYLAPADPIFNLSILSLRKLKPYRDLLYIQRTIPSLAVFRLAYRAIKLWATARGIYSSKFGFLGGVHITLMLAWVHKRLAHDCSDGNEVGVAELVAAFFHHYANFDWAGQMLFDAFFHTKTPRYHRTSREPMVVLGFHAPNSNVAHTATVPGLQTLQKEFRAVDERLSGPDMTWEQLLNTSTTQSGGSRFLESHSSYVKVDIQFWGRTLAKGKSLVGWVESRCLTLVVDIYRALPDLEVRIWPARFTDTDSSAQSESESKDYHGCYLIGLSWAANSALAASKEDRLTAKPTLEKTLDRFLTLLRTDDKNYDPSISWINVSLATPAEVHGLRLDDREWGDYAMELDPDSDDEEEPDDADDADEPVGTPSRKLPSRSKPPSNSTPVASAKLRPASDVLHRLRWDPALDPADYIIGYEDRFLGTRETGLERWKTEQTDDEFIPQHRILYFRRKVGDDGSAKGEVVWERATRIDKVFGSGVSAGSVGA